MDRKSDDDSARDAAAPPDEGLYQDDETQQLLAIQSNAVADANRSLLVFPTDPTNPITPQGGTMVAHAGENARETGDFRCEKCHEKTHVTEGDKIPKCPNCGNDTFDVRTGET